MRGSADLIGVVGLTPDKHSEAELGYWFSRSYWGHGIVTEAAAAVVSYGFEHLKLSTITSGFFVENPASGRVLRKLGFVETGRGMRSRLALGDTVPSVDLRLSSPTYS